MFQHDLRPRPVLFCSGHHDRGTNRTACRSGGEQVSLWEARNTYGCRRSLTRINSCGSDTVHTISYRVKRGTSPGWRGIAAATGSAKEQNDHNHEKSWKEQRQERTRRTGMSRKRRSERQNTRQESYYSCQRQLLMLCQAAKRVQPGLAGQ